MIDWLIDWLIDWFNRCKEQLNNISKTNDIREKLENLVKSYSEIFWSELGTIKDIENIETNSTATKIHEFTAKIHESKSKVHQLQWKKQFKRKLMERKTTC